LSDQEPGFVYVIATVTRAGWKTYVGWTLSPDRRLGEHNSGKGAKSTRGHFWHVIYLERHESRQAAMSREGHLKRDRAFRKQLASLWDGGKQRSTHP
jgi:putative endonuclease